MNEIRLGGKYGVGKFAIVDNEDYERLNQYNWTAIKRDPDQFYAVRSVTNDSGKRSVILMP